MHRYSSKPCRVVPSAKYHSACGEVAALATEGKSTARINAANTSPITFLILLTS